MPQEENQKKDYGEKLLAWKFPEFNQYQRNKTWYITAAVITGLLIIYAIFTSNILFALVIIMLVLVMIMMQRESREFEFSIYEDGVLFGEQFFEYKSIDSFYIIYEPPEIKSLFFEYKSIFHPRTPVNLMNQNPVKVREILLQYLPEDIEKENEPFSDQIARMFKL